MLLGIENDHARFRKIIKGMIRKNLRRYISRGELIGKKGKDLVSIPVPHIDLPHFEFDFRDRGGVGQGDGAAGTPVARGDADGESGSAGNAPGEHIREVELTLAELAAIMGKELELPRIEPRGRSTVEGERIRYSSIRTVGPDSMVHFRRSFKEALKRQLSEGTYDPEDPVIFPIRRDKRYMAWRRDPQPQNNAVIIYMMDVSGSMREEQKDMVRIESFWIDTWLRSQYKGIETRYIIHDAAAREVDRETFFSTRESGGTVISSAYELCLRLIKTHYLPAEWNIYPFHFSDGDNWSEGDNRHCVELLEGELLPAVNLFCYGQVKSQYGSGKFYDTLRESFPNDERVALSLIEDRDAIYDSIKDFLGKGK